MTKKDEDHAEITPEVEEDGEDHLAEMLGWDEGSLRVWEAKRGRRELGKQYTRLAR